MKCTRSLLFLPFILAISGQTRAQAVPISLCSLQADPEKYLNSEVQVETLVFAGIENPHLTEGKCSFRYALGDDYQVFGERFPVKHDDDWKLLQELLGKSDCASNVRTARAKITGTIIRVPATGTTPPNEMPLELVIQSVSGVQRVPVNCTPPRSSSIVPDAAQSSLLHESGHIGTMQEAQLR